MKSMSQLLQDWSNARKGMQKLQDDIPRIIGTEAVRAVKSNFTIQGYDSGNGITKWPDRAAATNAAYDRGKTQTASGPSRYRSGSNGTYKGSVFSSAKPLELQTRNMYNAIKYQRRGKGVFVGVDSSLIPYAKKQNEGGNGVPARQFMPKPNEKANPKMLKAILRKVQFERDKIMRTFRR